MPRPSYGIDVCIYDIIDIITPLCCKYNIHPNIITLTSIINNLILFYFLKNKKKIIFINYIQILLHYFFDCLDGEIARKCKKQTVIGGYLDTICDNLFTSIIFIYLLCKYYFKNKEFFNLKNIFFTSIIVLFIQSKLLNLETHKLKSKTIEKIHNNLFLFYLNIIILI